MSQWPGNARKERTTFGGLSRGRLMSRVKSTGNQTTEKRMVHLLRKAGLSGWRRHQPLIGHPDFIWRDVKIAVFVDGCFWHGHNCGKNIQPKTNADAWRNKIRRNKTRDGRVSAALRRQGWRVIRIWECQLRKKPDACIARVQRCILTAKSGSKK
ncbi:MAG: DNA mismatch endonuclease Vsr [Pirellulales bacterium]|nr:DNA mismatch endonuclease Vsr [Pirellulales bacterium]